MSYALRRSLIQLFIFSLAVTCCVALVGAAEQDNAARPAAPPRRGGETEVPLLSGLSAKQAKAAIQAAELVAEFQVGNVAQKPEDALKVYEVQPRQGTRLAKGSSIKVKLFAGTATGISSDEVLVPAVKGLSATDARSALAAAGIVARFHVGKSPVTPAQGMHAYSSDPTPGTKLKPGSVVQVTIYAEADPSASPAKSATSVPVQATDLPQPVAAAVTALQAREQALMQKPPKNLTLAQLDKEFADLRWKIAQQLGMYDIVGTISYAKSSVNLDPGHAERWDSLGDLCNLSGEVTSAIDAGAAYKKALAIEPARHETRLKLACAYLMMERPELAIKHIEYYLCGMDEKADPQAIGMYASTCALAGETARGIVFCKARLNSPQSNRYRIACAILENADGHRDIAVDLLAKVEKNEGDSSPLSAYAANLRRSYVSAKGK